jgi:hypothetical protein
MRNVLITLGMIAGLAFAGSGVAQADHTKAHKCEQARTAYYQLAANPYYAPYAGGLKQSINQTCGAGYIP